MKQLSIISLLCMFCFLYGCQKSNKQTPSGNTFISIIIDLTDGVTALPDEHDLFATLDSSIWSPLTIRVSAASDKDVNPEYVFTLPAENWLYCNKYMREARVQNFKKQVHACIQKLASESAATKDYSIIYRNVAGQLDALRQVPGRRQLFLVSDLMENDPACDLSFYDPQTFRLVSTRPDLIEKKLKERYVPGNLTGIMLYLVYAPRSYQDNNRFMPVARFYQHIFTSFGAKVVIANSSLAAQ